MYNVSELIGKEAITLDGAVKQGTVFNVYFDINLKECKCFSLLDSENDEIKWVEYKNVLSFCCDAFVIRCNSDILESPLIPLIISPINKKAYNQDGKFLGIIKDIVLDKNKVTKFITDSGEINSILLLSKSEEILVFNDSGKEIKIKVKREVKKKNPDNKIEIRQDKREEIKEIKDNANSINNNINGNNNNSNNEIKAPLKISQDKTSVYRSPLEEKSKDLKYSFLLGKRLQKSVYDSSGRIIAHENDLISDMIILKAKESGKLVTLALHSL